jgi:hypothetical protein
VFAARNVVNEGMRGKFLFVSGKDRDVVGYYPLFSK